MGIDIKYELMTTLKPNMIGVSDKMAQYSKKAEVPCLCALTFQILFNAFSMVTITITEVINKKTIPQIDSLET